MKRSSSKDLFVFDVLGSVEVHPPSYFCIYLIAFCVIERSHPELADLQEKRNLLIAASNKLSTLLRYELAEIVRRFGLQFNEGCAFNRSKEIEKNTVELSSPLSIIGAVEAIILDTKDLIEKTRNQYSKYVSEESASNLVVKHSYLVGRLVSVRTDTEREANKSGWDAKRATKRLVYILDRFSNALGLAIFSTDNASKLYEEKAKADEDYKALFSRVEMELPLLARLHSSTIGSSHRLPGDKKDKGDLSRTFGQLTLDGIGEDELEPVKETICIFE